MAYYNKQETENRVAKVVKMLNEKDVDVAIIYFDELNVANGWYLTGWCGQFEKGAVLVGRDGTTMLLGGPESEPFARLSSLGVPTRGAHAEFTCSDPLNAIAFSASIFTVPAASVTG